MEENPSNVGFTTGQNDSDVFRFVLNPHIELRKWEYVTIKTGEFSIIGRVERLQSFNEMIQESISYEKLREIVETISSKSVDIGICRTVGTLDSSGNVSKGNRILIRPGVPVYRSTENEMMTLFGYDVDQSIILGNLSNYSSVSVGASLNGLRRHVAIMAQTGAGKSNTAAVMIEELMAKGATIIVLDPHADYALMRAEKNIGNFTKVFKTPLSTGRYSEELNALTEQFTLRFQDLDENDLFDIMRIDEEWTTLREITRKTLEGTKGKGDLEDFIRSYQNLEKADRGRIAGRISLLKAIKGIFGNTTTRLENYLREGQLSILDLSGLDQDVMSYFCLRVLDEIYDAKVAGTFKYPVFVFIEEAHNFVGRDMKGKLSDLIKKIASEGRKFGMFLVVITQRPGKIDQDVLSQCNSQIILRITNPMDQRAIEESCEGVSASVINDLPSLNTGEAVLVGEFVKFPVIVRIRKRETREGGGDIDVVSLLRESLEARERRINPDENRKSIRKLLEE